MGAIVLVTSGTEALSCLSERVKYVYYCSDSNNTTLEGTLICSIILLGVNTDC